MTHSTLRLFLFIAACGALALGFSSNAGAQVPQLSQQYANPLFLNPALWVKTKARAW